MKERKKERTGDAKISVVNKIMREMKIGDCGWVGRWSCNIIIIHVELTLEQQQLDYDKPETGEGKEVPSSSYLHCHLVPIRFGLMADAVQQLVQAQVVVIQVGAILHRRLTDLCRIHQSQTPTTHLALPVEDRLSNELDASPIQTVC